MVLDRRRGHPWLIDPPSAQLLTAEGLSVLEFEELGGRDGPPGGGSAGGAGGRGVLDRCRGREGRVPPRAVPPWMKW
eukprot:4709487-Pyramimonas_sp.AAC.1